MNISRVKERSTVTGVPDMHVTEETLEILKFLDDAELDVRNILDIGCGSGQISLHLARQGYNVTALDKEGPLMEVIDKNLSVTDQIDLTVPVTEESDMTVVRMRFEEYEGEEAFDAVCCFSMLHYCKTIDDVLFCLAKIQTMIKEKGILLLSWLTYDTLNRKDVLFPSQDEVFNYLKSQGWVNKKFWNKNITHSHGGLSEHSHVVVYSVWQNGAN